MIIFKLLFLSYVPTILYVSFYQANSIAKLFILHKYQKKFESTNEPRHEKTNILHMRKQRRRLASR